MSVNPGVTILFVQDGSASITVNRNGHVWAKDCTSPQEAARCAIEARLLSIERAESMVRENSGYLGTPLQYYPPALRKCGFREYPVLLH
jgi:hypothetical protein